MAKKSQLSSEVRSESDITLHITPAQREYIEVIDSNTYTICQGPAGTGKTLTALYQAIRYVQHRSKTGVERIVIIRPLVENRLGFLPGTADEKMSPFLGPILDNLLVMMDLGKAEYWLNNKIEIIAPELVRGRSLNHCFVICEEVQNTTPDDFLKLLTRLGDSAKMVLAGDVNQMEMRGNNYSGLEDALKRLRGIPGIGLFEFTKADVVRNGIIGEILNRYDK